MNQAAGSPPRDLGSACQIGYVVPDIVQAMNEWSLVLGGAGFIYFPDRGASNAVYRGKPVSVRSRMAFSYVGGTQFEFIEPVGDEPSPYRDFLASGRRGVQHLGFWVADPALTGARLEAAGYSACYHGTSASFGRGFAYYERRDAEAPMIEVLEDTPSKRAFYQSIAEAVNGWSGGSHVRSFASFDEFRSATLLRAEGSSD